MSATAKPPPPVIYKIMLVFGIPVVCVQGAFSALLGWGPGIAAGVLCLILEVVIMYLLASLANKL